MSSRPVDVVDLDLVDAEPLDQPGAQRRLHARADLEPDDLAEAPAAQLVLDRLQQVVGLVGDLEVGVAGDPEEVVAEDVHAREQRVEVRGDDVLERDEGVLGDLDEARQHLLGHLDAGERLVVERRDRAGARSGSATGWRCRGTGGPGRRPAASAPGRSARGSGARSRSAGAPDSSQVTIRMPCSASAGRITSENWRAWRRSSSRTWRRCRSSTSVGDRPSGPRASIRASTWSWTPATRIMKNSSRLVTKMARNFSRSISGSDSSSASCRTRSLKSSHDSSRLTYSERVARDRAPARPAAGVDRPLPSRPVDPSPVGHATRSPPLAIAAELAGRSSVISSPLCDRRPGRPCASAPGRR